MERIGVGAEAILYRDRDRVVKHRVRKGYRHPELDRELRRARTRREARMLQKLPVQGPKLLETDGEERLVMGFIDGLQLKELLDAQPGRAEAVGRMVATLHDAGIIHGDLTTSNILVHEGEPVLIDFGLSFTSRDLEDKAVDLHLFKRALESKHYRVHDAAYRRFLKGYRSSPRAAAVLERLQAVERRGRNKGKA